MRLRQCLRLSAGELQMRARRPRSTLDPPASSLFSAESEAFPMTTVPSFRRNRRRRFSRATASSCWRTERCSRARLRRGDQAVGEVCFNTAMTGYQEILTDPSYAGQIVAFTFPHIGIVGTNGEDIEALTPAVRGLVVRADAEEPVELPRAVRARPLAQIAQHSGHRRHRHARAHVAHPREGHAARHRRACAGRQVRHRRAGGSRARLSRPRRARSRQGCELPADLHLARNALGLE
jgi:hypothetical protein